MMKSKDCATATALIIQGFLRPVELEHGAGPSSRNSMALFECLSAIRQECNDWAENLPAPAGAEALEPNAFTNDLIVGQWDAPRTPYNLISAAISLVREAHDLSGPEVIAQFNARLIPEAPAQQPPPEKPEIAVLIEAADSLVAEIDAAEERPVQKLLLWDVTMEKLRSLGVAVEDRCLAPTQW